jgi:hypothetical protein
MRVMRSLAVVSGLAVGAALLMGGCYASNANYQTFLQSAGEAVITTVSDSVFADAGTDFNAVIVAPATDLVVSMWSNYVNQYIPDDLPNNTITQR